ncbi:sigma-70 family RNA polymerase sigma factor [Lentisphaera marina]|uniref:RNA polymerase sigma factor n=1 Tax=Lentisphaera marina TaxID=1111041 RepID=UPI00236641E0|nr:sigma-70 family RNA polymerase sigma factor [Lentisphaera marina]MDD7986872.1 sigma-70 family RNA polymerase sigma factor [Lentisphaera marina]
MDNWHTRQTLLMRAKNPDDQVAWEEFVSYYKNFLKVVIYKINPSTSLSEDFLQAVLLEIWRSLPRFEVDAERAKFRTWLSVLVRNTVLNQIKKEQKQNKIRQELEPQVEPNQAELDQMVQKEWELHISRLALENISQRFTGKAMDVFKLSLKGNTIDQICNELKITPESAYTLKNRVKKYLVREIKRLRTELEQ